ncbi:hypothetical protein [Denitromonas iodatirespirans]|uniref:Uncharacterized protein n=1 Tax=Denitromonas iodatirespirans TaxID=2795389 RepID=A0A944D6V8_DENI1|nr:hypothetical protein [Denitromonas iodatirespirans]MBT0961110.1 hypothetical protein [Denitromonas iodatirespirans]
MRARTAQAIIYVLDVLAVPAVAYCIYDSVRVQRAIAAAAPEIGFDSGIYYLLLASVMWVLTAIQIVGLKRGAAFRPHRAGMVLVIWFVTCLSLANVLPYLITRTLEAAGYQPCRDTREVSRVSRGVGRVYRLNGCEDHSVAPIGSVRRSQGSPPLNDHAPG